jgi:hypothetical protein
MIFSLPDDGACDISQENFLLKTKSKEPDEKDDKQDLELGADLRK